MWVGVAWGVVDGLTWIRMTSLLPPCSTDEITQCTAESDSCLSYRLYSKGRVLGHKRGKRNTRPNTSLLQIEGVSTKEDAQFYLGKVPTLVNHPSLTIRAELWHSHSV